MTGPSSAAAATLPLTKVNDNLPLSEELCEFIGAIIGDGCIDGYKTKTGRSKYHVFITGNADLDRDYLLNEISSITQSLFQKTPHVLIRQPRTMVVNLYSKKIFTILTNRFGFIPGNKTYTVSIPLEIMNSEEKYIFATIRGIFDTDGCIYVDRRKAYRSPYPRIILNTVSYPLFSQLKNFLSGYFSLYTAKKQSWAGKYYELVVYGREQVSDWMRLIGFSNQKHLQKIYLLNEAPSEN